MTSKAARAAKASAPDSSDRAEADTVAFDVIDGIAWVRFNRPEKRNAMSPQLHFDMNEALDDCIMDDETKVVVLTGAGDSYGGDGSQHNVQFYVRPSDGRMLYFPHDMDAFYDAGRGLIPNGDLAKIIAVPAHARTYYAHLLDIIATTYNTRYMTRWANHFGQLLPGQPFSSHLAFIGQRQAFVTSQVNAAVPPATRSTVAQLRPLARASSGCSSNSCVSASATDIDTSS